MWCVSEALRRRMRFHHGVSRLCGPELRPLHGLPELEPDVQLRCLRHQLQLRLRQLRWRHDERLRDAGQHRRRRQLRQVWPDLLDQPRIRHQLLWRIVHSHLLERLRQLQRKQQAAPGRRLRDQPEFQHLALRTLRLLVQRPRGRVVQVHVLLGKVRLQHGRAVHDGRYVDERQLRHHRARLRLRHQHLRGERGLRQAGHGHRVCVQWHCQVHRSDFLLLDGLQEPQR